MLCNINEAYKKTIDPKISLNILFNIEVKRFTTKHSKSILFSV